MPCLRGNLRRKLFIFAMKLAAVKGSKERTLTLYLGFKSKANRIRRHFIECPRQTFKYFQRNCKRYAYR